MSVGTPTNEPSSPESAERARTPSRINRVQSVGANGRGERVRSPHLRPRLCHRYAATGDFYLVDYDKARGFCKQCKLKFVPSGHIYSQGKLQAALPMGKKAWDGFVERIKQTRDELA